MSSFKFNFTGIDLENEDDNKDDGKADTNIPELSNKTNAKTQEIFPTDYMIDNIEDVVIKANIFVCGDLQIGYVLPEDATKYLIEDGRIKDDENNLSLADKLDSDLLEGKYEGGLKIWECTFDLADYICSNEIVFKEDCRILDLGCGSGILGLIALLNGPDQVHFQDFNEEVLIAATIPNALLNISEEKRSEIKNKCRFFSGDWESFPNFVNENSIEKYDFILSSETIYNPQNYEKLCKVIKHTLKQSGVAFIAAKTYYFGVGGNTKDFMNYVHNDNSMNCESCWKTDEGVPREIMKLSFKMT